LESGNDGWAYGQVLLAFTNTSDHLPFAYDMPIELYVETEEDQIYPAVIHHDENPPYNYEISPSSLKIADFSWMPPGSIARNVWIPGSLGSTRYAIYFRVAEITRPTRIIFPSYPEWTIDLTNASIVDLGFPGKGAIEQAVRISSVAGYVFDSIPNRASMFLEGTCSVETDYYLILRLNYTIENSDNYQGAKFSGYYGPIALLSGTGTFYFFPLLEYDIEVGPGQTIHDYFVINTLTRSTLFPTDRPILFVLYGLLYNGLRGYTIISLDSCLSQ
jgi:hypothetical protein